MHARCTQVPHILMPKSGTDLEKWAVIACDQYTSQPAYWQQSDAIVGDAPSTLRLILPEVYLEQDDIDTRISTIHQNMQTYLDNGTLVPLPAGMILTERFSGGTHARHGLVLAVDLEAYSYKADATPLIRPTEKTVEDRIPPRLRVRDGAALESPHIMLLIDDPARTVIEPLVAQVSCLQKLYDTPLMQNGGQLTGWFVPQGAQTDAAEQALAALCSSTAFCEKYNLQETLPVLGFAVGDGNHSMATAKAHWENIKPQLSAAQQACHPARFVLAEVVNIHDESLLIEPIHRVLFDVDAQQVLSHMTAFFAQHGATATLAQSAPQHAHAFPLLCTQYSGVLCVEHSCWSLPVAAIQAALDDFLEKHPTAKLDYIHGADVVQTLSKQPRTVGFLLPDLQKDDLFRGVIFDGVLPRKTFSMGHAHEKRYYMEMHRITP